VLCAEIVVSASGRLLVQRSPTQCGVSEYDREASIMRTPWPTSGCCAMGASGVGEEVSVTVKQHIRLDYTSLQRTED
jgi:hypothetical protein